MDANEQYRQLVEMCQRVARKMMVGLTRAESLDEGIIAAHFEFTIKNRTDTEMHEWRYPFVITVNNAVPTTEPTLSAAIQREVESWIGVYGSDDMLEQYREAVVQNGFEGES